VIILVKAGAPVDQTIEVRTSTAGRCAGRPPLLGRAACQPLQTLTPHLLPPSPPNPQALLQCMEPGDIIIDGGNEWWVTMHPHHTLSIPQPIESPLP
jgi:hypothetical protein